MAPKVKAAVLPVINLVPYVVLALLSGILLSAVIHSHHSHSAGVGCQQE